MGKKDYYADGSERKISKEMDEMLWRIDLHDNAILPFRYDFHSITLHTRFLAVNKKELAAINSEIQAEGMRYKDEKCQDCYLLGEHLKTKHSVDSKIIENKRYMCTFEDIARTVFKEYGVPFKANVPVDYTGLRNTSFMKCIMIVIDIMNGSLMCNYYTDSFEFEEKQPLARGYQEHNPFRYGRSINVASPLPTYNNRIEDMSEMVLNRQDRRKIKDFAWVRDVEITKNNLLVLQQPIEYKGTEWILLACRISVRESNKHETAWVDTYDYWCCTNEEERIMGINEDRYLTIELREYDRPADRYYLCNSKPWLCKSVPAIGKEEFFDEHSLVFPPAEMINQLGLTLNHRKMSWINKDGEEIILCNNSRNSYYHDPIGSTIFMRKDCYEQYAEEHNLKFFAFTEKYIPETGYAPETSLHYELEKGKIVKIYKNDSSSFSEECRTCQYGLKSGRQEGEPFMTKYMQLIDKLGYRTRDEDFDEL